jgi:aspartyl-tRNA(Asn)/glutamyl-tRNA(Gln) amidotransferase subunit A
MREGADHPGDLGVLEASRALRARELSAVELLEACEERIAQRNGGEPSFAGAPDAVNAFVRLYPDEALAAARVADARLAAEGQGAPPLCGVPIALKDLYAVAGLPLTASSAVLADAPVPTRDATAWARLRAQGMVLVGHTHTHEFAAGGTTDQVGNPWDVTRSAGGSSGGSGAALAARMVPAALGSDTCGSLRIPAALCGISTIKPTRGRVPLDGILPLAATLDHPGPMARTVADAAALLAVLADGGGQATPLMPPPAPMGALGLTPRSGPRPLAGMRIALTGRAQPGPAGAGGRTPSGALAIEDEVAQGLERARAAAEALGATIVELDAPPDVSGDDLNVILLAEMHAHHAPHRERRAHYRPAIRELLELGDDAIPAAVYLGAQERRAAVERGWDAWFREHRIDALLEPTVPTVAQPRGSGYDPGHLGGDGDPLIVLTSTWDITGFPVVALPAGVGAASGLPVGVSLVAPRGEEAAVVQLGVDLQEADGGLTPPSAPATRETARP